MAESIQQLTPQQVKENLAEQPEFKLLDVREVFEYEITHIAGAILVSHEMADEILKTWDKDTPIICYCHHGMRSQQACQFLQSQGFTRLYNMTGGIDAWSVEIDPSVPQY
jgi:rhodanese-related sulfurtransferase